MTQLRTILFLLLMLAVLLLAAGCESDSPQDSAPASPTVTKTLTKIPTRHVTTTNPLLETTTTEQETVRVTDTIQETESPVSATVAPPANYHPEYIRMDATTYTVGDIVQFYLVNKGTEIKGCNYAHPAYTVYHLSPDGTRMVVASSDPKLSFFTIISEDEIATSTGPFNLDTRKWTPGRYLIRFDCGNNVAREFVIMEKSLAKGLL
jgi:hypothetical protein